MTNEQHRKEINKVLAKPFAITAGLIGLIQGIAWTVLSVLSICCYYDSIEVDVPENATENAEYYQLIYDYFLNSHNNETQEWDTVLTPKEFSIFVWFYIFFSAIETLISGGIIWAMIHNQWHLTKSLFGGWSIIVLLISLVDVVLTGLLIGDYLKLINRETEILVTYGIVMSLAARGYILLIINIVLAAIMTKYTIDIILKGEKENHIPIIQAYESSGTNPPWFQEDVKNFWSNPPNNETTDAASYNNYGFERSQSFLNFPTGENDYSLPRNNVYNAPIPNIYQPPTNLTNTSQPSNTERPTSFSEAIAKRTATIGKNKGRRSPVHHVPPPVIPDPDYTPPNSPNQLRSVLKTKSNYSRPQFFN